MKPTALVVCLITSTLAVLGGNELGTGSVRGTAMMTGSSGEPSVVPGAKVKLSVAGSAPIEVEADASGKYEFASVLPGTYQLEITSPGLTGTEMVTVVANEVADANVTLDLEAVKLSVTVSADAPKAVTIDSVAQDVIGKEAIESAPNKNERFDSAFPLIPGVVRGPDGLINMKGARASQSGSLVNSANVSDPVTGNAAIRMPIDVVQQVQVIANPYDPEYGRLSGAVSSVDTRTGNYEGFHASFQNILPRPRKRDDSFIGIESATPRLTVTGPLMKDKVAFTQSLEYRYIRTPVESLAQLSRDSKLESLDSYSQADINISQKQSATVSLAIYPQKLDFFGLNTFTPQASTPDLHQRGNMTSLQHRLITGSDSLLLSQFSFKRLDADVTAQSDDPYRLLLETTQGGYYNRQHRETERSEWQESYSIGHLNFWGTHQFKAGFNYTHSTYDGHVQFNPVDIVGGSGVTIQRLRFGPVSEFAVSQNEVAWFASDKWRPTQRLTLDYGVRFDHDSVTEKTTAAPRAGLAYSLTKDNKTVLRAGAGLFYDRVTLNIPAFPYLPPRTVLAYDGAGNVASSTGYSNVLSSDLQNPRSANWNVELDRQLIENLILRVGYQQRTTSRDFVVSPVMNALYVNNDGLNIYKEFQVTARYRLRRHIINASYVRSKAYGDLNDFNQFFGNTPQVIIQPDQRARLPFDAPNRFLFWGEFAAPGKFLLSPAIDIHTGFPYSVQNEQREYVGSRDGQRFPTFASVDLQVTREVKVPLFGKAKAGVSVFNLLNQFNPRDVQTNIASENYGGFYNGVGRTFRGKFVLEF